MQLRIQDFADGGGRGANPKGWATNLLFGQIVRKMHENEENWTGGGRFKILMCRSATAE